MDPSTYVVDTVTLIERIHEIKQWVYDGSVSLLIPRSSKLYAQASSSRSLTYVKALEEVQKAAEVSLVPKDAPKDASKEATAKRHSGKPNRREEKPLFNINPRVAREFLKRAQDGDVTGMQFQSAEEEFSQWKEEEEKEAAKAESPVAPPTSFAEALLRKLNLKDGSNETKGEGTHAAHALRSLM